MRIARRWLRTPLAISVLISTIVAISLIALRSTGILESWELAAYDAYIRLRPVAPMVDPRVVLITIDESEIRAQQTWPLPDATLARALEVLIQYQPRAIGVDIFRDMPVPPGHETLRTVLAGNPHIITVMKIREGSTDSVPPPPMLRETAQIGFSDLLVDRDGIVRRGLLFMDDGEETAYSFALRLALRFLQAQGIILQPDATDHRHLRLGPTTIRRFRSNDSGYVAADARGYQFLLDFREPPGAFPSYRLTSLLAKTIDPKAIKDRVVLIGVNAVSVRDPFRTPYGLGRQVDPHMPGVELHAHIVSQLLRFALDGDASVRSLDDCYEGAWILLWSAIGGVFIGWGRSPWRFLPLSIAGPSLFGLTFVAFLSGWWIPVVPSALACSVSAVIVTIWALRWHVQWKKERFLIHLRAEPVRLARFVNPRTALNDEIYHMVSKQLGSPGADADSPASLRRWAAALYDALAAERIYYVFEKLTYGADQEIRRTREVAAMGVANCLEASLIYAAALERSFMDPVIIHLHRIGIPQRSAHAVCGFWNGRVPLDIEALITDESKVRKLLEEQCIVPVETMGFTIKKDDPLIPERPQIPFDEAVNIAREQLTDPLSTRINFLVNIRYLRDIGYDPMAEGAGAL